MAEDPYEPIAGIYDFAYEDFIEDVDFYENLARSIEGPILELGVGSGRAALPLAESGYEVVGIDTSVSMLEQARLRLQTAKFKKGSLEVIEADMRDFDLGRRFGLIFVAANTFQHLLTTRDQLACLKCVGKHMAPSAIFALSVRSPATVSWEDDGVPAPLLLDWTRTDPATGDQVMKFVAAHADQARMIRQMTYVYDRVRRDGSLHRSVFATELRHSTQAELTLLLQQVGLRVTHVYGDYDLSPVGMGDNIIVVARAEAAR